MTDSYETECGHPFGMAYNGYIEEVINNNGFRPSEFSVGGSITGPKGQAKWTTNNSKVIVETVGDPNEAAVTGCNDPSCDNFHGKQKEKLQNDLKSQAHHHANDEEQEAETPQIPRSYNPYGGYMSIHPNIGYSTDASGRDDDTAQDDHTHITINPEESIGDPYQHLHANGNAVALDGANEQDGDVNEQNQPAASPRTTSEAIENEGTERDSSEGETAPTEAIEDDEQPTTANTADEPAPEQNATAATDTPAGPTVQATANETIQIGKKDGTVSVTLGEQTEGTVITVSPRNVDDLNTSFDLTEATVAFDGINDGGTIQIAPGDETMSPTVGGGLGLSGNDGDIHVSPGTAGDFDASFGTDGDYQLAFDDGQGLDGPSTERDDTPAHDSDSGPTENPESEPDNAHDNEPTTASDNAPDNTVSKSQQTANGQGTEPDTAQPNQDTKTTATESVDTTERDTETGPESNRTESDLPEETNVSERSRQDKRKHGLDNVLASNDTESDLSEETEISGRTTQTNRTHDGEHSAETTEPEPDREDHAGPTGHDDDENEREREIR